ncbi:hypothetical protein BJ508DRAFT_198382, partial [Ascobolus immersus RN42]
RLGFEWKDVRKNVYYDGHEREEVIQYRREFLDEMERHKPYLAYYDPESAQVKYPAITKPFSSIQPIILVTHDESIVNANDGIRQAWHHKESSWIRPKGKGRGIMISDGIPTRVPLGANDGDWEIRRDSAEYLEYGKDNYWDGEKMTDHILNVVLPMLELVHPGCQYLFLFDNATNHCSYAEDALVARRMNWGPGGSQPLMRD